jgi:nucleoside-diphosphate-sugar epimerase
MPVGSLAQSRILVTGATGFIGSHLCKRLVELGAEVFGVSRSEQSAANPFVRWWQADLVDPDSVKRVVDAVQPEVILHLAGEVVGHRSLDRILPTLQGNLLSTVNLLVAAAECGCRRVVLTGSIEEPNQDEPGAAPSSPYAASKFAATSYGRMFHALYALDVVILRVYMVYGPGQKDLRKLVPYVILSLLRGETPRMSSGIRPVDWIYVDDVVAAFVAAAGATVGGGEVLEVGSGELVTVRELVERLAPMVIPGAQLDFDSASDRPLEQVRKADTRRLEELLDWRPKVPLDEGLQRTVDWYRDFAAMGSAPHD